MTADIPLFKRFEQYNSYSTYVWPRPYGSDVVLQFNLNHPDEELRRIFQDVRFRRAMSLAINRQEINDIVYFGYGVPRQLTVVSASRYFEPEFATAWAEFDPARANAMFDEMGLVDRDGDGRRERFDGKPLANHLGVHDWRDAQAGHFGLGFSPLARGGDKRQSQTDQRHVAADPR